MNPPNLKILHRDREFLAVHKPSGMASYDDNPKSTTCCKSVVRDQIGHPVWPVHRLDKGTCGVLLFALNAEFASRLHELFAKKKVHKTYTAWVFGTPPDRGDIKTPLTGNKDKIPKPAWTHFERIKSQVVHDQPLTLLKVLPRTGRYHQIRRHLKSEGYPIVGDESYAPRPKNEWAQRRLKIKRLMLSAVEIQFFHPTKKQEVVIRNRPGPEFDLKVSGLIP